MGKKMNFSRISGEAKRARPKTREILALRTIRFLLRLLIKLRLEVGSQELKRREFLKLSAMIAGGGLAAIVLESSLKSLNLIPKASGQLLLKSNGNHGNGVG